MGKDSESRFLFIGVIILLGILLFNSFSAFSIGSQIDSKVEEAKELARPAKIEIIKVESSCSDCFDVDDLISILKDSRLDITGESSLNPGSDEANGVIAKYKIEKLPAVLLKGEIDKVQIQNFNQVEDALVFTGVAVPYESAFTHEVVGKVSSLIISDKGCEVCNDFSLIVNNLKQNGVFIGSEKEIEFSSAEAKGLINKFGIEKVPTLLLTRDLDSYPSIAQSLSQTASVNAEYYVVESRTPYVDVKTGKTRGLVKLTMLDDPSCSECYDVEIHKPILARFNIAIEEENKVDIASDEGKRLIEKYSIENVPTVILSGDVDAYEGFEELWERQVGTVEEDRTYVFRQLDVLGKSIVYKNIQTNQIVGPATRPITTR